MDILNTKRKLFFFFAFSSVFLAKDYSIRLYYTYLESQAIRKDNQLDVVVTLVNTIFKEHAQTT